MLVRAALIVPFLFAGCLDLFPEEETRTDTPIAFSECLRPGADLWAKAKHHPGFAPLEYQLMFYSIDREGDLFFVRAHEKGPGTGSVSTSSAVLRNVTSAQVRTEMQRLGVLESDTDYNVSVSWRDRASSARLDGLCDVVLAHFYAYEDRYDNPGIADCDAFEFTFTTPKGTHTSYSYCRAGPQEVRSTFDAIAKASRDKLDIDDS